MKNIHVATRLFACILSVTLLLGLIPALATEAEPQSTGEKLLSEIVAANQSAQLFERHTSQYQQTDDYYQGELVHKTDIYATAETAYTIIDGDIINYATPDRYIGYTPDEGISETLLLPEEYLAMLDTMQKHIYDTENEVVEAVEEKDGELLVTSRISEVDMISDVFGDASKTEYEEGTEIVIQYRVDAADLSVKEYTETLVLPDGSVLPRTHTTYVYDEPLPDPAAQDSPLAPLFDETAEKWQFTVVFAAGSPEERTCKYAVPVHALIYLLFEDVYEDAEFTQPFLGMDDRMEYTLYVKNPIE